MELIITMKEKYYLIHVQGELLDGEVIKEKMHWIRKKILILALKALFEREDSISPQTILKLDQSHNTGPYWHAEIKNLNEGCIYAFRIKQKNNGINNNYEKKVLLDPCSRGITGWESYKRENALKTKENTNSCLKSVVCDRKLFNFKDYPRPKHSW